MTLPLRDLRLTRGSRLCDRRHSNTRERGSRADTVWTSPTAFTRVGIEQTGRYGAQVRLMLSGRRLTIGSFLGPKERVGLAEAVEQAIRSARAERYET